MSVLTDIANDTIRSEIEEFVERPEEIKRLVNLFSQADPVMQAIAATVIQGEHHEAKKFINVILSLISLLLNIILLFVKLIDIKSGISSLSNALGGLLGFFCCKRNIIKKINIKRVPNKGKKIIIFFIFST